MPAVCVIASIVEKQFRAAIAVSVATFGYSESNRFGKLSTHVIASPLFTSVPNKRFQDDAFKATRA
jgi:hypothetical protein